MAFSLSALRGFFCTATITLGLAECPLSGTERLQLSISWRLKCTKCMLKSNGAFCAVCCTEAVRISEGPLREVPLYDKQGLSHLQIVLIVLYFLPHLTHIGSAITPHAALWCALNGLQLQILSSPLQPLSSSGRWIALHVHVELQLSDSSAACLHDSMLKCDDASLLGLYSLYSLLFMTSFARALLLFSLPHAATPCGIEAATAVCRRNRGIP